ncbi:hypothetical protein BO78DRAFT_268746, partial [Aspergillus sclerotiicarbonarius CBS 121057]
CGGTPEEARRCGCNFDILTFCWVFEECDDIELTREFLELEDWKWFTESGDNETVPREAAGAGETDLFVSWGYHTTHCTYMYKKMHRAIMRGKPMDGHLGSYNHTEHCAWVLTSEGVPDTLVNTRAEVRYPSC